MSLSADAIRLLASKGLSVEDIAQVAEANEDGPKRSANAERQARYRARKSGQTVTSNVTRNADESVTSNVTERNNVTPLACATENNLTTTVIEPNLTSPNYDAPDRAILDLLECQLTDAVGVALASKAGAPKLFDLSPILGLLRSGDGPPCDLQADVLPTLRAAAARSSPGSIKTWAYFTGAIREARDRRLTGAPVIQINPQGQTHERAHAPSQKRATREGNHARAFQGALAAAVARQPG